MIKSYEAPQIFTLGTVAQLTEQQAPDIPDKCGGSGDQFLPQILSQRFELDCNA
jgi:hypothetical protein